MTLPNFIIVGAAKSGTTSLYKYLAQHPEIYVPPLKEPAYFSDGNPNYINSDEEYEKLFDGMNDEKVCGEATPAYLFSPQAPEKMKTLLGNIKIIIILRNPADRAYSLWGHNTYQVGIENLSFQDALEAEQCRINSKEFNEQWINFYGHYQYFNSGLYYKQVKRYIDCFGKENVKIFIFEQFIKNPVEICKEIYEYIGIDPTFKPNVEKHNVSCTFKNKYVHNFIVHPPGIFRNIYDILPVKIRIITYKIIKSLYDKNIKSYRRKTIDKNFRKKLIKQYLPDIKKLEKLIDKNLSIWY